jgi:ferredoxin, 2Fe-2S
MRFVLMPKITFVRFDGERRVIDARGGQSLMQAAIDRGIDGIEAACGGACSCATCHVYVEEIWLEKLEPQANLEREMLSGVDALRSNSRLSCQIKITEQLDGMVVQTPERQA